MANEWSVESLAIRVVKMLANWQTVAEWEGIMGTPVALHAHEFREALGERYAEGIDYARIKGWIIDLGPTAARHYRLTEKGRALADDVSVIGPTDERGRHA